MIKKSSSIIGEPMFVVQLLLLLLTIHLKKKIWLLRVFTVNHDFL